MAEKKGIRTLRKQTSIGLMKGAHQGNRSILFVLKFFIIFFAISTLIELADLSFLTNALAKLTASALGLSANGSVVFVGGSTFVVTNACTGLMSAAILAAIIFSLKKPTLSKKVFFFITGLIMLMIVNVPRVMLVLWAAKAGFDAELVHVITWFIMSAVVLLLWYYGTKRLFGIKKFDDLV